MSDIQEIQALAEKIVADAETYKDYALQAMRDIGIQV
jgi:hypothetical protein